MVEAEKYEVLEKIGHGSFGVIRKVRRKSDGHVLCRKEISYLRMSSKEKEQLQAELAILKELRHPNIVAYYEREHLKATQDLHIYMEYCEDGDLGKRIKDMKTRNQMVEEDFVWSVFSQLITALYRCHYGVDAPEVGKNVMGLSNDAKPLKSKQTHAMILHRDLKPENVFLGADACVKLGDFGLSKIMQSHDFASTYVGTPFYMSPEICAAEQYSLHSDIWALGCIMYELCAKEPPFNAKTHLDLIQKIRLGRFKPLSSLYSQELQVAIGSCLRVNPQSRPDTAQLLNIPMVKLKRKELEIVRLGKLMKAKEEQAANALRDINSRTARLDVERESIRRELDDTVRREWEVKARLEIDRQVQIVTDKLFQDFEAEVTRRVAEELRSKQVSPNLDNPVRSSTPDAEQLPQLQRGTDRNHESQSTTGETDDFASTTDLSELSLESPSMQKSKSLKKNARTPFSRAQTMFENSPFDIQMAEPSPAPIGFLGLSPRRNGERTFQRGNELRKNIFAVAAEQPFWDQKNHRLSPMDSEDDVDDLDDDEDFDDVPALPSPTRLKSAVNDPFKSLINTKPQLIRQKTAPSQKPFAQPALFSMNAQSRATTNGLKDNPAPKAQLAAPVFQKPTNSASSPNRRMSKLPSATALFGEAGSPARKVPAVPTSPSRQNVIGTTRGKTEDIRHTAMVNSHVQGRTLVELAQARSAINDETARNDDSIDELKSKRALSDGNVGRGFGTLGKTTAPNWSAITVWDPERDEMPSPFLVRGSRTVLAGAHGGPGMRHLR